MCLSKAIERPDAVIESGVLSGHEYHITHNGMGHLCGYIKLEPGHPWHGKDYHDIPASVHGSITFAEPDIPCDKGGPDSGYWIGFDCGHSFDAPDLKYVDPEFRRYYDIVTGGRFASIRKVRDVDYVRGECALLALQANAPELIASMHGNVAA